MDVTGEDISVSLATLGLHTSLDGVPLPTGAAGSSIMGAELAPPVSPCSTGPSPGPLIPPPSFPLGAEKPTSLLSNFLLFPDSELCSHCL